MNNSPFAEYPSIPPHIAEWEEILLRYELTPRAMRGTIEEPGDARTAAITARVIAAERTAAQWLSALRTGDDITAEWAPSAESGDAGAALDEFAALRARNFAGLQRRGIQVWEWKARHPHFGEVTAFQFVSACVARDARELAALRDAIAAERVC